MKTEQEIRLQITKVRWAMKQGDMSYREGSSYIHGLEFALGDM